MKSVLTEPREPTPELRAQVAAQYRAVAHMATAIAEVHSQIEPMISSPANDAVLSIQGNRSASFMEQLGDMLNAMDAVEEEDEWLTPVMREAQRLWPQAAPTITSWHRIDDPVNPAPKDGTLIEAWHHIWKCWLPLKYRTGVVDGCEWVEATGAVAWPSDAFTHWRLASLPPAPDEGGE